MALVKMALSPHAGGMMAIRLLGVLVAVGLGLLPSLQAQETPAPVAADGKGDLGGAGAPPQTPDFYIPANGGLGVPSGIIPGVTLTGGSTFGAEFSAGTPSTQEVDGLQGCGGVSQNDYTTTLFNMPETFKKFKDQDVNTDLAKQLMTYNMAMPQTAALFGQLNTFGNERFQQFQAACSLTAQQADARKQYVQACMGEILPTITDTDVKVVNPNGGQGAITGGSGAGGRTMTGTNPTSFDSPETLQARKTAVAYEICLNQYNDKSRAAMKSSNQTFAEQLRLAQDMTSMLKPLLCADMVAEGQQGTGAMTDAKNACWPSLLLPQVRLCSEGRLDSTGKPEACDMNGFGVRPAPVRMAALMDTFRVALGVNLTQNNITLFRQELRRIPASVRSQGADIAAGRVARVTVADGANPEVANFQNAYLNCRDPDILRSLKAYSKTLQEIYTSKLQGPTQPAPNANPNDPNPTLGEQASSKLDIQNFNFEQYKPLAEKMLPVPAGANPPPAGGAPGTPNPAQTGLENQITQLAKAMEVAAGCTVNSDVPLFDPQMVYGLSLCQAEDWDAFYTMAFMDTAAIATDQMLRFTQQQLQTALGRLEANDPAALVSGTTAINSDAIRQKMALAIRTIMMPSLESQLKRLDEIQNRRGVFANRVRQIYTTKAGCVGMGGASAAPGGRGSQFKG